MWVFAAEFALDLPLSQSLKDKRKVRLRVQERIKQRFNASIIETDLQDDMKVLYLGVSLAALSEAGGQRTLDGIRERIYELTGIEAEIIGFESFVLGDPLQ